MVVGLRWLFLRAQETTWALRECSRSLPHPSSISRTNSVESPQLKCKYPHLVSPSSRPVPFEGLSDWVHSGWSPFLKASCAVWHNLVISQWLSHHMCRSLPHSGLPRWHSGTESACQCRRCRLDPWVGKIPWSRKWQPTAVFLPEELHGQRSLAGYGPWGLRESDTVTARATTPRTRPLAFDQITEVLMTCVHWCIRLSSIPSYSLPMCSVELSGF